MIHFLDHTSDHTPTPSTSVEKEPQPNDEPEPTPDEHEPEPTPQVPIVTELIITDISFLLFFIIYLG